MPYVFRAFADDGDVTFHAESCPNFEMLQFQLLKATQRAVPHYEHKISCLIDILLTELLTTKSSPARPAGNADVYGDVISHIQEHFAEDLTLDSLVRQFAVPIFAGNSNVTRASHLKNTSSRCVSAMPNSYWPKLR